MEYKIAEEFGDQLSEYEQAQNDHYPRLHSWLKNINNTNQIVYLNVTSVNYIGYSYAKQIFRRVIANLLSNEYNFFSLCFKYDKSDYKNVFEGLIYALNQKEYSTFLVGPPFKYPKIIGYITASDPRDTKKELSKKTKQKAVLEYILRKKEVYTNDIAESLDFKLPNTNRILKELGEKKLIKRVKETSPTGGPIYLNKSIFNI